MASESKFAEFLKSQKIDPRRVLIASATLEKLTLDDRKIKLAKRRGKAEGATGEKETRKPRSGRPITNRAMEAALAGKSINGPVKTRMLKAINHVLTQKKASAVELKSLF